MKTKEECYQQASFESLAESSTETRQDVIYRSMEIYANEKLANFISSNPVLADSLPLSDEEIEREGERHYGEVKGGSYHAARPMDKARFIKGAKWARDFKR